MHGWLLSLILSLIGLMVIMGIVIGLVVSRNRGTCNRRPRCGSKPTKYTAIESPNYNPNHLVTLVTLTSASRFDASIDHIVDSLNGVRGWKGVEKAPSLIVADGMRSSTRYTNKPYQKYLKKLSKKVKNGDAPFHNTRLYIAVAWEGPTKNVAHAVKQVTTPYIYSNQHDLVFDGTRMNNHTDLPSLTRLLDSNPHIDYIAFPRKGIPHVVEGWFTPRPDPEHASGLPIKRIRGWSDADHLAKTSYWKTRMLPWLPTNPEMFPEDHLHHVIKKCGESSQCLNDSLYGAGKNIWLWDHPMVTHLDGMSKL